jgi:antitoxin component YwqK of YwqJK toxin-antitoxin module
MKIILILIIFIAILGCGNDTLKKEHSEAQELDNCKNAVKFPNATMTELQVNTNYTGDLNNYWGEDTTKLDIKHTFVKGKLIQSKFYYENGQVQEEYNFKCQSLHGETKYYYENGKIGKSVPYLYGRINGAGLAYDTFGIVRQKVIFKNDSMIGEAVMFDESGNEIIEDK